MEVKKMVENVIEKMKADDPECNYPIPLKWYPDELAYQVISGRKEMKKSEAYATLRDLLINETEIGNISRQEAVSMIPPLLMDIQPHHKVLDICAAPGSKTAQIIEAIHANDKDNEMPSGLVLANDADEKRAYMLVHQAKRLQSPCLLVTNNDGTYFPNIQMATGEGGVEVLQFDRILCDVPCSGDGTLRKNPSAWKKWTIMNGYGLHSRQLKLLIRACQMVKVGGRVVYSTCSLNPIENEAVVAQALRLFPDALEIVDCSQELNGLKRLPGMLKWSVMSKSGEFIENFHEIPTNLKGKFSPSYFSPTQEEAEWMKLERSLRIMPHLQDTGGFYVAVISKKGPMNRAQRKLVNEKQDSKIEEIIVEGESPLVVEEESALVEEEESALVEEKSPLTEESPSVEESSLVSPVEDLESTAISGISSNTPSFSKKPLDPAKEAFFEAKRKAEMEARDYMLQNGYKITRERSKEEPFIFIPSNCSVIKNIKDFYGMQDGFPVEQFLVRSFSLNHKTLYFVSDSVKRLLSASNGSLKVVNTGIKAFCRNEGSDLESLSCPYRLQFESIHLLNPFLKNRIAVVPLSDLLLPLSKEFPKIEEFSEATRNALNAMEMGCAIFSYEQGDIVFPIWKGRASMNAFVSKQEKISLYKRLK